MCEGKWECSAKNGGTCGSGCQTLDGAVHCHKNRLFKKCFVLIGLLFMYWIGVQMGELRVLSRMQESRDNENYGYRMMGARSFQQDGWNQYAQPGVIELRTTTSSPDKTVPQVKQ